MDFVIPSKDSLVQVILNRGKFVESGCTNSLSEPEVRVITQALAFAGANPFWRKQSYLDLAVFRYRIFDWLLMSMQFRSEEEKPAIKILVYAWLKAAGVPQEFVGILRNTNFNECREWEKVELP